MTHSYTVNGITCSACIAKVTSKLLAHPEITAAEVTLDQKAVITMRKHLSLNELQEAIGNDTKYKINKDASAQPLHSMEAQETKSWIATYKPLLIIGTFILGVSALTANGSFHMGMNYFMAGFFLVFSFFKMLDLKGFASSYAMYDLLAMKVPVYGYIYPFIELGLGLSYLSGYNPIVTNWVTVIVLGLSSIGVIRSVLNKQKIRCACLGAVFNLPMSTVTIVEDMLMVAMAATMLTMF